MALRRDIKFSYVIEVTDWGFSYSFGLPWNDLFEDGDPFWESNYLAVAGTLLVPDRSPTPTAKLSIWPMSALNFENRSRLKPTGYGGASLSKGQFEAGLHVLTEMFHPIMTAIEAGKIRYIELNGEKLFRNDAKIDRFWCWRSLEDERRAELQKPWIEAAKRKPSKAQKKTTR